MSILRVETASQAAEMLEQPDSIQGFDSIEFSAEFGLTVKIGDGYQSQMPAQYLDAYHEQKRAIYQLVALVQNGTSDTKSLTSKQLEEYRYVVTVTEGSSVFDDNLVKILEKLFEEAVGKMSGDQIVFVVLGLAVVAASGFGFRAWLQARKEQRIAEMSVGERRHALDGFHAASREQTERLAAVMEKMIASGGAARSAAEVGEKFNNSQLRAASHTNDVEIEGLHLDRQTAKELRSRSRRKAEEYKITKEMRVVDVNTADPLQTVVVLEDLETAEQHRVAFSDRIVGVSKLEILHGALRDRSTALFRLQMRALDDDDTRVQEVIDVMSVPTDQTPQQAGT